MRTTNTARILVVEGTERGAQAVSVTLTRLGYEVLGTASAADDAIRKASALRPDLVLMEVALEGTMDGVDAAEAIRKRMSIPIIYLSATADDEMIGRLCLSAPAAYLAKPVNERELRYNIEIALHRHDIESGLHARERWHPIALRAIADAVIATDLDHKVIFLNECAEKLTGWTSVECLDRPIESVLRLRAEASSSVIAEPTRAAMQSRGAVHLPPGTVLVRRDGRLVPVEDSAAPILDDDGTLLGAVIVLRDVSARRAIDARLALSERLASLGTTVAGVAHEINNPLTLVVSNLAFLTDQLTKMQADLNALSSVNVRAAPSANRVRVLKYALADASEGADRVAHIVKDLKNLSRPDGRGRRPVAVWTAIDNALRMAANDLRQRAQVVKEAGPVPRVDADPIRLEQLFSNLLINAAHFIPAGKLLDNHVRVATSTSGDGFAVITIEDSGSGIIPEHIARVFDPFFTTKPVGLGTGLGLSICQGIVADLAGTIAVESILGKGTRFRIVLPPSSMSVPAPERPITIEQAGRGRVLIVDDERGIVAAVERALGEDHDVTGTTDPLEALELLTKGPLFDMVLCDLTMPIMTGMDLYREIRARAPAQAERFVFLTGGAFTSQAADFLAEHPGHWMDKPFSMVEIRRRLATWLSDSSRTRRPSTEERHAPAP